MNVLIITGGNSSEREISLISAANVKRAVEANGHTVEIFDFKEGWIELRKRLVGIDVCFPVMHGKEGEDGELYQRLFSLGKPFVGSDPKGASIAFDKILFKEYCNRNNIITAPWSIVSDISNIPQFGLPCVLKAANGGSSHEVVPLLNAQDLESKKVKDIFQLKDRFFVEKHLQGIEITVGVLLDTPLPVIEITPPPYGWFDYRNKYSGKSRETAFAPSLSETIQKSAQNIALKIHRDLHLRSFSRTDIIVVNDIPYVLEVNTPGGVGLTPKSLFPKAAEASGIGFEQLVEVIITSALQQH